MKVLIFGGNRFVGKRVLNAVVARGHSVTLVNRGTLNDGVNSPLISRIHLDRNNEPEMKKYLTQTGDFELVLDFSCYLPAQAQITLRLLNGRVSRYLFVSTQSVYDDHHTDNIRESAFDPYSLELKRIPLDPTQMDYSAGKQFTEAVFFQQANFPVVAIRFPFILGNDDYTQRFQFHVNRVKEGLPIYFPAIDSRISLIHAGDASEALLVLAGLGTPLTSDTSDITSTPITFAGPLNLCSKNPISLRTMIQLIEEKTGKKAIFAENAADKNHSPYGVETDRFMNTDLLSTLKINPRQISEWLPSLIV